MIQNCRSNNNITRRHPKPINDASHTGWTTYGHTGEDVNTYAYGPGAINSVVTLIIQIVRKTSSTSLVKMSRLIKINNSIEFIDKTLSIIEERLFYGQKKHFSDD